MIRDFNRGTVAWTDWNILLDHKGGPNHVQNYCFAPIHADTNTGELIYTPTYYYIGHFSKFIRKGARRISTSTSISFLLSTTFQNTDNSMATVVMNQSDTDLEYNFLVGDKQTRLTIPARAMQTLVY
jgi:glucosylceramidase